MGQAEIVDISNLDPEEAENQMSMIEFDSKRLFTPNPQPILSLLGVKISKVLCGKDHVLALTDQREVYAWGSNDQGQLGI